MLRRVSLLFVIVALVVLATGTVHAAPRLAGQKPISESAGVLDRLWGWLSTLFQAETASKPTRVIWEAEGSHWDPNGNH
jgi:hypothetical protein